MVISRDKGAAEVVYTFLASLAREWGSDALAITITTPVNECKGDITPTITIRSRIARLLFDGDSYRGGKIPTPLPGMSSGGVGIASRLMGALAGGVIYVVLHAVFGRVAF